MSHAEQQLLQSHVKEYRRQRALTAIGMDIAEALIWKCRKRPDGTFMVSYRQLAGMARCCRDTAMVAINRLVELGILLKNNTTRSWSPLLRRWVQAKNIYRLVSPSLSESEKPAPNTKEKSLSLPPFIPVPAKEVARKQDVVAIGMPAWDPSVTAPAISAGEARPWAGRMDFRRILVRPFAVDPRVSPDRCVNPAKVSPLALALERLGRAVSAREAVVPRRRP